MTAYDLAGIEDTTTRIERDGETIKTGLSPLDAFDYAAEPLYEFIESYSEKEPESLYGGAGLQRSYRAKTASLGREEEKLLREWAENRDELTIITEIETVDGDMEDFYWEMRQADPESVNQPFSMVNLKSDSGYNLGLRVARDYDPDILHRSAITDRSDLDIDHTSRLRYSGRDIDNDEWGWVQEPYIFGALDGEEAVHDQMNEEYGFLPELTPNYWIVDWNESPEYEMSDMEMATIYQWGEPLFTNGLSPKGARRTGEHAASLHSLGLMTFLDRKPEEFVEDPHPEGFRVQQRDLEFAFHTVNESRINGRDMQDLVSQIEQGIRRYHNESGSEGGSETEKAQVKKRPRELKDRKNELMARIDEDITHWVPDNVPRKIDPDVFPREMTRGLEWE